MSLSTVSDCVKWMMELGTVGMEAVVVYFVFMYSHIICLERVSKTTKSFRY
jgi:hypothetical protein